MTYHMPLTRTEVELILNFLWSGIKLPVLTLDLSFCHNLCCRCPNGSCKPIWNIHTSITLQWYKKLLNTRRFNICNHSLKVWESIRTSTPKMGVHLGVWVFMFNTLSHSSWPACKPCLGREPKFRVMTFSSIRKKGECFHWNLVPFSLCNFFHLDPWPSIVDLYDTTLPQANLGVPKFLTLSWQV